MMKTIQHLEWKPEFRTGMKSIDYEHQQLVDTINAACDNLGFDNTRENVLEYLGLMYEKISAHFALEEKLMLEGKYKLYSGHREQHKQLLENLRTMMDAYEDGACDECNQSLDECLISWFSQHFQTEHGVPIRFDTKPA